MDESRENIPPTECPSPRLDGAVRHMEANPLAEGCRFTSTPAQCNRTGRVNSRSLTPCYPLLPDITPVTKYMRSRKVLTVVNSPEFLPIHDESAHVLFDVSTMDSVVDVASSPVFSQDGGGPLSIPTCCHSDIDF